LALHRPVPPLAARPRTAYGSRVPSDPQLELRVSRLENDTSSIYHLISDVRITQEEHSRRFEQIDKRFEQVDARFEQVEKRFEQVDARFEQVDKRFEQVDKRFEGIERHLDQISTTLTEVVRRLPEPPSS